MPISGKEMLRKFLDKGWEVIRKKGSHIMIRKGEKNETIPVHGNKDLKKGLEKKLLKSLEDGR
jgi:predicted RNA binding protein YcfA (HicA-like mRNA interferase family)